MHERYMQMRFMLHQRFDAGCLSPDWANCTGDRPTSVQAASQTRKLYAIDDERDKV